jgi:hypothetical protein
MPVYRLSENNSGGSFWLRRAQYDSLFEAGWKIDEDALRDRSKSSFLLDDSFGDADGVPYSWRDALTFEADSIREAVESFEAATGQDFFAEGCNCCGAPFWISSDTESLSGDSVERVPVRPW